MLTYPPHATLEDIVKPAELDAIEERYFYDAEILRLVRFVKLCRDDNVNHEAVKAQRERDTMANELSDTRRSIGSLRAAMRELDL